MLLGPRSIAVSPGIGVVKLARSVEKPNTVTFAHKFRLPGVPERVFVEFDSVCVCIICHGRKTGQRYLAIVVWFCASFAL